MDVQDVLGKVAEKPWLFVGALIAGYFFMRGGSSRPSGGGFDATATLSSQQIASQTDVALANVAAGYRATDAQQSAVTIGAMRDVMLGAQQFVLADRTLKVQQAVTSAETTQKAIDSNASFISSLAQSVMGHKEAVLGLMNQRDSIVNSFAVERLGSNIAMAGKEIEKYDAETGRILGVKTIDTNADLTKFALPFTERMNLEAEATTRNLAWRAQKIAKITRDGNIFNSLIGGFTNLASTALMVK